MVGAEVRVVSNRGGGRGAASVTRFGTGVDFVLVMGQGTLAQAASECHLQMQRK
jgi:hypothetical protein